MRNVKTFLKTHCPAKRGLLEVLHGEKTSRYDFLLLIYYFISCKYNVEGEVIVANFTINHLEKAE